MSTADSSGLPKTRRRGDALVEAIHEATRLELDEKGYAGVNFDGIARRARVSKPVLYRRYRSRAHLVASALVAQLVGVEATTSSGSLRTDLHHIFALYLGPARHVGAVTLRALLGEADDELSAELRDLALVPALASIAAVVEAARERGELGALPPPDSIAQALLAILQSRALHNELDTQSIDDLINDIALPLYAAHTRTHGARRA